MFLFCKWFSSLSEDETYRNDLESFVEEILNLESDE
jgi:hypothetical protein